MSDSNQGSTGDSSSNREATTWTKDQWNKYVESKEFIQYYTQKGVVDPAKLVKAIGIQGYLMLMENCPHLVVYDDTILDSGTREGRNILENLLKKGELPFSTLVEADIIPGNKADDLIQDAIAIASECLQPGAIWDNEAYEAAMLWAPDQWRECMRYSDFSKHFVHNGVVQISKLKKHDMPQELLNRMINRALNLVVVGRRVIDADTDAGIKILEQELVEGKVSLARLIEADVFTREEAIQLHQDAIEFAKEFLREDAEWTEEERKKVIPWIPEQWDALVDSTQFDAFTEDGFVEAQKLKTLMGAEIFNIVISKVHTLIEVGSRVIIASTAEGRKHLQEAAEHGKISLETLVYAGLFTNSDVQTMLEEAQKISQSCFKEGAKWDSLSTKDAMKWSSDEWDTAITGIDFAKRFVKGGIVHKDKFVGIMEDKLYRRMVERSSYLIPYNHKIIDIRTAKGKELAETGLWKGDVPIHTGIKMGFISRDQAAKLFSEARTIAVRNVQKDKMWSNEDRKLAVIWSEDQWDKALEVVNFSAFFTEEGVIDRDRAVVAMGPALFDAMVKHVDAFVTVGSTVYDASTKEGYNLLRKMGEI